LLPNTSYIAFVLYVTIKYIVAPINEYRAIINNEAAINYYKEAYEFTKWVNNELGSLNTNDAETAVYNTGGVQIFENKNIEYPESNFYYLTTKTKQKYTDKKYKNGDFFVFGPETRGLPEKLLNSNPSTSVTIPMKEGQRSLNLSNSAAIVLYEAIRQNG